MVRGDVVCAMSRDRPDFIMTQVFINGQKFAWCAPQHPRCHIQTDIFDHAVNHASRGTDPHHAPITIDLCLRSRRKDGRCRNARNAGNSEKPDVFIPSASAGQRRKRRL